MSSFYESLAGIGSSEAAASSSYEFSSGSASAGSAFYDLGNESVSYSSSYGLESSSAAAALADAAAGASSYSSAAYSSYGSGSTANQVAADLLSLGAAGSGASYSSSGAGYSSTGLGISNAISSGDRRVLAYGLSEAEQAILRSSRPPQFAATEEISVNGQRGLWTNKAEVVNWRGPISINQYQINQDANPEIIRKQTDQQLTYVQDIAVRYLRPPTPPPPGEIIIAQQSNTVIPPAPPVVIRQVPPRPITPPPLVVREAPPPPPPRVDRKLISIAGKVIPPPPRKVVIERLAPLPNKPQNVFIERWLPYNEVKRKVIFQRSNQVDPIVPKPRNAIIQWDAPRVQIRRELRNLGVFRANPSEYVSRYGATLRTVNQFPAIAASIRPPQGVVLAAEHRYNNLHELYGDVQALGLINLEREGLGAYSSYLSRLGVSSGYAAGASAAAASSASAFSSGFSSASSSTELIDSIFSSIDRDSSGRVSVEEAQRVFLILNSRLGRNYGEDDVRAFFAQLDINGDGFIDVSEFRRAFDSYILI